ncbi:MAG: TIGR04372 family glycosyltransferase [Patescibacteria group bacterium]
MKFRETIYRFLGTAIVTVVEIVRIPLFLLWHRKELLKSEFTYAYFNHSFGHTVIQLDYLSRLYFPHRVTAVCIAHPDTNPYVFECFSHNIDMLVCPQIFSRFSVPFTTTSERVLRFFLHLFVGWSERLHVVDLMTVYRTVSLAGNSLRVGLEESGTLVVDDDHTGYARLIDSGIGHPPRLPEQMLARCRDAIGARAPRFFDKPFVTLHMREKGVGKVFATRSRNAGPHENYRDAVSWLTQNGYHVVGTGETRHEFFRDIDGYWSLEDIDLPPELLNIFLLTECALFIGQMSGGYQLPSSHGILCLITDAIFHRLATFRRENILLFKHLRRRSTGEVISLVDIYRNHRDLAFGYHFREKDIEIIPNTPEEILEAVRECIAIVENRLALSAEDRELIEHFRALPFEGMHLKFLENRTTLHELRRLRKQGLL